MVDYKKYHDRIEMRIGEAMAADKILEGPWFDVVIKDLNLMSYYFARELELQLKTPVEKKYLDGTVAYKLPYEEWPPYSYYIKGYPYYTTAYYPVVPLIPSRYIMPTYRLEADMESVEASRIHQCDLCNTRFNTADELSDHVNAMH